MLIKYNKKSLEKECNDYSRAIRSYGQNCAKILHRRIRELKAAESLDEMGNLGIGRCHALKVIFRANMHLTLSNRLD